MSNPSPLSDINLSCVIALLPLQQADTASREVIIGSANPYIPASLAAHAKVSPLWPNDVNLKFSFLDGTSQQHNKVLQATSEWVKYANVIFTNVPDVHESDIRISFQPTNGNWSYLGMDVDSVPKNAPTMNFASVNDTDQATPEEGGIILHQWGHALGLVHEHVATRIPTLNSKATINYLYDTQRWSRKTAQTQVVDVYNNHTLSNYAAVDDSSIMKYFFPSSLSGNKISKNPSTGLSDHDKAFMVVNYPRSQAHPDVPDWTIEYALKILKWDDQTPAGILAAASSTTGLHDMRRDLADNIIQNHDFIQPSSLEVAVQPTLQGPSDTNFDSGDVGWCGTDERITTTKLMANGDTGLLTGVLWEDLLWLPHSIINYCYLEGSSPATKATSLRRQRVQAVLDLYQKFTSLKFKLVDPIDTADKSARDNSPLRISFGNPVIRHHDGGLPQTILGFGVIGRRAITLDEDWAAIYGGSGDGRAQPWTTVFFGDQPGTTTDVVIPGADNTLYHELGHFLGLFHEHDNPNLVPNPDKIPLLATLTDPHSVLLYEDIDIGGGKKSVSANHPSDTDRAVLSLMYPDSDKSGGEFHQALLAFGFGTDEQTQFLTAVPAALTDTTGVRIAALRGQIGTSINKKPRLAVYPRDLLIPQNPTLRAIPHPLGDPVAAASAPGTGCPGFLKELMTSLKNFFNPGGNQVFTLQFPGRFLVQSEYAWDTSNAGIYGQFVKPVAVNEAEFRLVDQLYDLPSDDTGLGGVIAGPNGINLSIVYEQLLNNFLPRFVDNGLPEQQEQIRQWLLKEVPITPWIQGIITRQNAREASHVQTFAASQKLNQSDVQGPTGGLLQDPQASTSDGNALSPFPGRLFNFAVKNDPNKINLIDLSEVLMSEYLYAKEDWETERDALITQATMPSIDPATGNKATNLSDAASQRALDALTRQLAHITASRQAQLAAKYSDAVIFGRSHLVQDYMGYLDISSAAEALQAAKNSLRESAMSSLNGSMKVYPVQLTPVDWSQGLSTSFTVEDLTADPDVIKIAINAKAQQIDTLNAQLVALQMGQTGDPATLKQQLDSERQALDTAQGALAMKYATNVIEAAKTYIDAGSGNANLTEDALQGVSKTTKVARALLDQLPAMMAGVQDAQDKLTATSRAFSQINAAYALANATDTKAQQEEIRIQIQSLTAELNDMQTRWKVLTVQTGAPPVKVDTTGVALVDIQPLALPQEASTGGSRWQTISFQSRTDTRQTASNFHTKADQDTWSVNLWLGSASGGSSSSSASSASTATASTDTIDLAFRATLVTIDRGGWFQPQFFKESAAYYKINPNFSWVDDDQKGIKGIMPAFPIGFVIAKDIVIRVVHKGDQANSMKHFDEESSSASGGILCFSYSQSSSSTNQSESSSYQAYQNGFVVKIPGPQILGYMIEKLDPDLAVQMPPKLPGNFFIPDNTTDPVLRSGKPPVEPPLAAEPPKAPKNTIDVDALRDAINKLIDGKLADIVSQVQHGQETNVNLTTKQTNATA